MKAKKEEKRDKNKKNYFDSKGLNRMGLNWKVI